MSKTVNLIAAIKTAAKALNIEPQAVSKNDLLDLGLATDWSIKRAGGISKVRAAAFPDGEKDLKGIAALRKNVSYISKLEREIGNIELLQEEIRDHVRSVIKPLPKIKTVGKLPKSTGVKREVVAMLNDTHIGVIIDPEEIGNLNCFDFTEAGRRFAYFVKEVAEYKPHARKDVQKLHLVLNGDNIAGLIHGLDTKGIHLMIHQMNAMLHILTYALAHLAQAYPEIEVHGIAGNHGRAVHKNHGQRAVSEVYDSYENIAYYGLSVAFRNNKNIKFNFPKTPYGFFNLFDKRVMYAHGDHVFSKTLGNPGSSINVKGISSAIKDFNAGEIAKGNKPINLLLLGHVHVMAHFITNDGVEVYIAPSLSGTDAFAHSLTINTNQAAQLVFESTKDYVLGDSRLIRVLSADKDSSLDSIIPTYKKELSFK